MMKILTIKAGLRLSKIVGRYVALKPRGGEHWGLCPFHKETTPSFSVNDEKGVYSCFGCNVRGDVFDFIQHVENTDFLGAKEFLTGDLRQKFDQGKLPQKIGEAKTDTKNRDCARKIWHETCPAQGTLVEVYLQSRGITIPPPPTLRFHPSLIHSPTGLGFPALVAAVSDETRKIRAIQRIYLHTNGQGKAPVSNPKLSLGGIKGAAVRLSPTRETLVLTEGIEDGLSILQQKPDFAVWATLGAWNLCGQDIPASVKRLIIGADNDAAGEEAAKDAAAHYAARRFAVKVAKPQDGAKDFNASLLKKGLAA